MEKLSVKESFEGEFKKFSFFNNQPIGEVFIKLKRGWNQFHISIYKSEQSKGYGVLIISEILEKLNYISIPASRVINTNIYKVIDKLDKNKYGFIETVFEELIIYKLETGIPEIFKNEIKQ